jgi:hypothetical protein
MPTHSFGSYGIRQQIILKKWFAGHAMMAFLFYLFSLMEEQDSVSIAVLKHGKFGRR